MNTLNLKSILDIQLAVKRPPTIPEFDNKQDYILFSLSMMMMFAGRTLTYLTASSLPATKSKVSKEKVRKKLASDLGNMLQFLFMLVDICHYDLPDDQVIEEFTKGIPVEMKIDPILSAINIMGCISGLTNFIYIHSNIAVWEHESMPKEFEDHICELSSCLILICDKYDLTLDDLINSSYDL